MVQWLCLITRRLFDGWMLYWRYWFSVTQTLNLNYICRSVTYISWSSDFALCLENYLMDKCHNWNTESVWCKYLSHKMYVGQLPTFHDSVILSWRLLNGFMLCWRYWFSVTPTLNWNYICRSATYISCSSDFASYLEDYLMDKCHNWNAESMWCKDLPDKMYSVCGSVTYISWSSNVVLYLEDYLGRAKRFCVVEHLMSFVRKRG